MMQTQNYQSNSNGSLHTTNARLFGALIMFLSALLLSPLSSAADIVVYKSPTCGCCNDWVSHLEDNGFSVQVHDRRNMQLIKRKLNVPDKLQSCHTAVIGDYVVEGHVPANDIVRLLREKPAVKGISVPGMPMGSPGMEGPRKDNYDVLIFDETGNTKIYSSY